MSAYADGDKPGGDSGVVVADDSSARSDAGISVSLHCNQQQTKTAGVMITPAVLFHRKMAVIVVLEA
jgi:hypothetical protein